MNPWLCNSNAPCSLLFTAILPSLPRQRSISDRGKKYTRSFLTFTTSSLYRVVQSLHKVEKACLFLSSWTYSRNKDSYFTSSVLNYYIAFLSILPLNLEWNLNLSFMLFMLCCFYYLCKYIIWISKAFGEWICMKRWYNKKKHTLARKPDSPLLLYNKA